MVSFTAAEKDGKFHLPSLSGGVYVVLCDLFILLCYLVYTIIAQINPTSKREENNLFFKVHSLSCIVHVIVMYAA